MSLLHVNGSAPAAAFGEAEEIVIDTALSESEEVSLVEANWDTLGEGLLHAEDSEFGDADGVALGDVLSVASFGDELHVVVVTT